MDIEKYSFDSVVQIYQLELIYNTQQLHDCHETIRDMHEDRAFIY